MVSLLKTIIIVVSLAAFVYAASLAIQGDLESEIIMRDYVLLKAYLGTFLNRWI